MNQKSPRLALALAVLGFGFLILQPADAAWQLTWADEFGGSAIDKNGWAFDVGTGPPYPGWGNNELEYYTSRPQNVSVSDGVLHIVARRESFGGSSYTSARLKTLGHFSQARGLFEFRAKLPQGQGFWPALWMMPRDSAYGGWAASGEIDVLENNAADPSTVIGTLHFGGEWPEQDQSHGPAFIFPYGESTTNFHVYALEWTTDQFRWYVDGQPYQTQNSWWSSGGAWPAPFDQPFYLIMNLAVGGNFVGDPGDTVFPGEMQVDYARAFQWVAAPRLSITLGADNSVLASWPCMSAGYVLESSPDLAGTNWTAIATNQVLNATNLQNQVLLSPGLSPSYYRLKF